MLLYYIFIKTKNFIQSWFNKNRLKFLKYPSITGFLSAIYDINVRDPKLKKNFIEESFDLGLELWLGYVMHDVPILLLLSILIYPRVLLRYMLTWFWVDLFFAQAYNFGQIFYGFNLSLLFPALTTLIVHCIQSFLYYFFHYIVEFVTILISEWRLINLSSKFNLSFFKIKFKKKK